MNYIKISLLVCLLCGRSWVSAAELCATNSAELRAALAIADGNNEHDVIKIAQGFYETSGTSFYYQEEMGWDVEISGGWSEFFSNPCGQQTNDPYATVLDAAQTSTVLGIRLFGGSSFTLSNIAFLNGYTEDGRGAGLQISKVDNLALGTITIENNVFLNNEAKFGAAMSISGAEEIVVRNNLLAVNHASAVHVASVIVNDGYGIYFTNNTVVSNTSDTNERAGVYLVAGGTSQLLVANNVLQDNGALDLEVFSTDDFYFKHNNYGNKFGFAIEDVGNFSLPSRFEPGLFSYTPALNSPLVNTGIKPCSVCPIPLPFDETWSLGAVDLGGAVRVENGAVDIGAYESNHESDLIFWNRFEG